MTAIFDGGDRLQQGVTPGTNIAQATLNADGVWFSTWVYVTAAPSSSQGIIHIGTGSFANVCGIITNASGNARAYFRRSSGTGWEAVSAGTLTAGWHLLTAWIRQGDAEGQVSVSLWHNGAAVVESLNNTQDLDISAFTTLYLGSIGTGNYFSGEKAGDAFGTGNPADAHAYAWNSGSAREITGYNFAGNANATIDGYWPLDREDTGLVDNADVELQDAIGTKDTWTIVGVNWSTRGATFNGGQTGTLGTPALTDATSLSITVTLPSNNWGTPDIDAEKILLWSTRGYGRIVATGENVSGVGTSVLTVDVTLDRSVYADEAVIVTFEDGWCADGAGNSALSAEDVAVTVTLGAANGPTTKHAGASMGKQAWAYDTSGLVSFDQLGFPYFDAEGGDVDLTASYPIETGTTPNRYNGAQINPLGNDLQGLDERQSGSYSNALRVTYPATVSAGDVIVKQIGRTDPQAAPSSAGATDAVYTTYKGYGACFIIDGTVPSDTVTTAICGYDGSTARPSIRLTDAQIDAILDDLPKLSTADLVDSASAAVTRPPAADMLYRFGQLNMGRILTVSSAAHYRNLTPLRWTARDGFHGWNTRTTGTVLAALSADYSNSDKRDLMLWALHHGMQWYWMMDARDEGGVALGNQGHYGLTAMALRYIGEGGLIAGARTVIGGKEVLQSYKVSQDDIDGFDPHDEADGHTGFERLFAKRKTVTAVSGADVTCNGMGANESEPNYDEMILTDGVSEWDIIGYSSGTKTFTLDTSSHGLTTDDIVWAKLPYTPAIGDADWGMWYYAGSTGLTNQPARSAGHASWRRSTELWAGQWLALQAMGLRNLCAWDPFFEYVERCNARNQPTETFVFPPHWQVWDADVENDSPGATVSFVEAMVIKHAATLASTPQFDSPPPIPGGTATGAAPRDNLRYNIRYDMRHNIR